MPLRLGQERHRCREQQCEYNEYTHSIESRIPLANGCQLVHRYDWQDEENEDDHRDDDAY